MNLEAFLRKFKRLAPKTEWRLDDQGRLRTKGKVRHCPITFVVEETTKHNLRYHPEHAEHAAALIKLDCGMVDLLMESADGACSSYAFPTVRRRLLEAAGLKERIKAVGPKD